MIIIIDCRFVNNELNDKFLLSLNNFSTRFVQDTHMMLKIQSENLTFCDGTTCINAVKL